MNQEVLDLALLFTSAFVGATIAFLAALITFTFHNEIWERLVQEGLIVPPHGSRPTNPALQRALEHREQLQQRNLALLRALEQAQQATAEQRANNENNQNRHLRARPIPAAFTIWQHRDNNPWRAPPDQ